MKIIKYKYNYKHVELKDLSSFADVKKQKKDKFFYDRVVIVIKADE